MNEIGKCAVVQVFAAVNYLHPADKDSDSEDSINFDNNINDEIQPEVLET